MGIRRRFISAYRRIALVGGAAVLVLVGIVAFAPSAFAWANIVTGTASCVPVGAGYTVTWSVANDYNLSETGQVTAATYGLSTVSPLAFTIGPSGNGSGGSGTLPYKAVALTQALPATATGTLTLSVAGTYSDNVGVANSGSVTLPTNCPVAPPVTTPPVTTPPVTTPPVTTPVVTPPTPQPGFLILKTERVGSVGTFVRGPVRADVGAQLQYQIVVTNTGNTSLRVVLIDPRCDAGTLSPTGPQTVAVGKSIIYSCSHVLLVVPSGGIFRNVATATGTSPQGTRVGPVKSAVAAQVLAPTLKAKSLKVAKPPTPVTRTATFTG